MKTQSFLPAVWLGSYSAYNAGSLYGGWVEISSDVEEMAAVARAIFGAKAPTPKHKDPNGKTHPATPGREEHEEWGIFDADALAGIVTEHSTLEDLAAIAEYLEESDFDYDYDVAFSTLEHACGDIDEARRYLENYQGCFEDPREYASETLEASGLMDVMFPSQSRGLFCAKNWDDLCDSWLASQVAGGQIWTMRVAPMRIAVFTQN